MAAPRLCSIADCCKPMEARGWCAMHYMRWRKYGDPLTKHSKKVCTVDGCDRYVHAHGLCWKHSYRQKRHGTVDGGRTPPGDVLRYLEEVVLPYQGEDCLPWQYAKNAYGYGKLSVDGRIQAAHRVVCERISGAPPTPQHEAAHSCGNSECVNARHLRWATRLENEADKYVHGTRRRA